MPLGRIPPAHLTGWPPGRLSRQSYQAVIAAWTYHRVWIPTPFALALVTEQELHLPYQGRSDLNRQPWPSKGHALSS